MSHEWPIKLHESWERQAKNGLAISCSREQPRSTVHAHITRTIRRHSKTQLSIYCTVLIKHENCWTFYFILKKWQALCLGSAEYCTEKNKTEKLSPPYRAWLRGPDIVVHVNIVDVNINNQRSSNNSTLATSTS